MTAKRRVRGREGPERNPRGDGNDIFSSTEVQGLRVGRDPTQYKRFDFQPSGDSDYRREMESHRKPGPNVIAGLSSAVNMEMGKALCRAVRGGCSESVLLLWRNELFMLGLPPLQLACLGGRDAPLPRLSTSTTGYTS